MKKDKLKRLKIRSRIIGEIRRFFVSRGFWEAETPLLVNSPCMEPHLDPFITEYSCPGSTAPIRLYLPTSPEFHMKRLLAAGSGDIFQIIRSFRNSESGRLHEPEFTILEWYRANAGYERIMEDCEYLLRELARFLLEEEPDISSRSFLLNLADQPFERISVETAWKQFTGIDIHGVRTAAELFEAGRKTSTPDLRESDSWEVLYFKIFLHLIEPCLGRKAPVLLYDYPASMAALARCRDDRPEIAMRFELYINGIELANAFDELTDPREQRRRFEAAVKERRQSGKKPHPVDIAFLQALEAGMPPAAGIALGVDRLVMLLTGARSIQEIVSFPFFSELERNPE